MGRVLASLVMTLVVLFSSRAPAAQVVDEAPVHVLGGSPADRLVPFLPKRFVILGERHDQLVVLVVDPRLQTGGEPPRELFRPELPDCEQSGPTTCCAAVSDREELWIRTTFGWINSNIICPEQPERGGREEPTPIDVEIAEVIVAQSGLTSAFLTVANEEGQTRKFVMRVASANLNTPCYDELSACPDAQATGTKICRASRQWWYVEQTCPELGRAWAKAIHQPCDCK